MEIYFATKDENNRRREKDFLKLSPDERLIAFIEMISVRSCLPSRDGDVHPNWKKGNFVIDKQNAEEF